MLYLFSGSDIERSRAKWRKLASDLRVKRPEAGVFSFDAEKFDATAFQELLGAGVLFGSRALVLLDRVLENKEHAEVILESIEAMADSDNVFFVLEGTLTAVPKRKFEKYAKEVYEHELKEKAEKKDFFNLFAFSDAIGARAPKDAWIILTEALQRGIAPEELFYKAVWQVKMMAIASTSDPVSSGLKPFVYGKARRSAENYRPHEISALHRKLVSLHHEARRGKRDFGVALERLVLDL